MEERDFSRKQVCIFICCLTYIMFLLTTIALTYLLFVLNFFVLIVESEISGISRKIWLRRVFLLILIRCHLCMVWHFVAVFLSAGALGSGNSRQ